jgi:ferritin-like metal-binding protein YciE
LYSAENQQIKAMPKVVKNVESDDLRQVFSTHFEESKNQIERLKEVFGHLGKKPTGKHCSGMEGAIDEVKEALQEDAEGASFDAGVIGAALRVEHYEVAGYTVAALLAKQLGERDVVALLEETLAEERAAAKLLVATAKAVFKQALKEEGDDEEPESKPRKSSEKKSAKQSEEDEQEADAVLEAESEPAEQAASVPARRRGRPSAK